MDEVPTSGSGARRSPWVVGLAAFVLLTGPGAAIAEGPVVSRTAPAGLAAGGLRPAYHGHHVSPNDVAALQSQGKATASAVNRELACQGIELFFDSPGERDAYLAEYGARFPVEPAYVASDPCLPYRDSPQFVTGD